MDDILPRRGRQLKRASPCHLEKPNLMVSSEAQELVWGIEVFYEILVTKYLYEFGLIALQLLGFAPVKDWAS